MKEVVVISGKGGTGKTSITAALAYLGGRDVILTDCDVDAADMHLLLQPDFSNEHEFYSGQIAIIDQDKCSKCGSCYQICRFNAISFSKNSYHINPLSCEGCGYCARVCQDMAISNKVVNAGKYYISSTRTGNTLVHAHLAIGASNSGKLVAKVKELTRNKAKENNTHLILVDGSPGIGCPVVSSLSGASLVVMVTEPSVSGLHDLERIAGLVKNFNIRATCIINKADLNPELTKKVKLFLEQAGILLLGEIPYNLKFSDAMLAGKTIVEFDPNDLGEKIKLIWQKINQII